MANKTTQRKKKIKRAFSNGVAHIQCTMNNTIVSISDVKGNVICWASSGTIGYKGSKKSTPFAAGQAAESAGRAAMEQGIKEVDVDVKGPGTGRETAIRSLVAVGLKIKSISDSTPIPHNGCRPPKKKRG